MIFESTHLEDFQLGVPVPRLVCVPLIAVALALCAVKAAAAPLSNITAIAAGGGDNCALAADGNVKCWGHDMRSAVPVNVPGLPGGALAVAVNSDPAFGSGHGCALFPGAVVKCWGRNSDGQLGNGTTSVAGGPVDVVGLPGGVTAVAIGRTHSCALTAGGAPLCWGDNSDGQLGDGTTTNRSSPSAVAGLVNVTAVSPGRSHTCALTNGGGLKCWGANTGGALGDGTNTDRQTPADVSGFQAGASAVSAGGEHTCALTTGGGVKCWGYNFYGELGDGTTTQRLTPVDVTSLQTGVAAISAGASHTCALIASGGVKCWGSNFRGALGDGSTTSRAIPADVLGLTSGVVAISAKGSSTCALMISGTVRCWGDNGYNQLGNGSTEFSSAYPVVVGAFTQQTITFETPPPRDVNSEPFTLVATATSGLQVSFSSLTPWACTVSGSTVTSISIGLCSLVASQVGNDDYAPAPQVTRYLMISGIRPGSVPRLANISTRMKALAGEDSLIAGFILAGSQPKTVVVRARGPSLRQFGVQNPSTYTQLRLHSGDGRVIGQASGAYQLEDLIATGFAVGPYEAALLMTLPPGAYTVVVGGDPGVAIVEVFEVDRPESPLINISTRGQVLTGEDVMIGGFVIHGSSPQTVVVRARGPSLAPFGITNPLADPMLQLVRSSDMAMIAVNDDWGTAANSATLAASGFAPSVASEAAILITLEPGAYTAIVTGGNGGTGVGIVEVFAR